jgi:hypothetical protein
MSRSAGGAEDSSGRCLEPRPGIHGDEFSARFGQCSHRHGRPALRTKNDVRWLGAAISAGEGGMAASYGVILLQDLSCALADDNAGCHRVASGHAGHDGTVCDAKVVDSIDPEIAIND